MMSTLRNCRAYWQNGSGPLTAKRPFHGLLLPLLLRLLLLLLLTERTQAKSTEVCNWIGSQTRFSTFNEFHRKAPSYCILHFDFHKKLTKDADNQIRAGILSPEAANNWVDIWSGFIPSFVATIGGLTKTYKCETDETTDLYRKMMAAVASAARNKDPVSQPIADKLAGGKFIVLSGDDADIYGSLYDKVDISYKQTRTSSTVIRAPSGGRSGVGFGGLAAYTVCIHVPQTYKMYIRARAFDDDENAYWISGSFFGATDMLVRASNTKGNFEWAQVTSALVQDVGIRRLRVASYSKSVQIDSIILHSGDDQYSRQLDHLAISSTGIAIGPVEVDLGDNPGFRLVETKSSLSGAALRAIANRSRKSKSVIVTPYFKSAGTYTVYLLARSVRLKARAEIESSNASQSKSVEWTEYNFTWKAVGTYKSRPSESVRISIQGDDIDIAAVFFHVNPVLVEMGNDILDNAVTQSIAIGRVCGNGAVEFKEECDGGTGCESCKCITGFKARDGKCAPICGDGQVQDGEDCDGGIGCQQCKCADGYETKEGKCVKTWDCIVLDSCDGSTKELQFNEEFTDACNRAFAVNEDCRLVRSCVFTDPCGSRKIKAFATKSFTDSCGDTFVVDDLCRLTRSQISPAWSRWR